MQQESRELFPERFSNPQSELSDIHEHLRQLGWQDVNFGFSLGRKTGALDMQKNTQRRLIYQTTPNDLESYGLMEAQGIPHFTNLITPLTDQALEPGSRGQLRIVDIPMDTKALDSMRFIEQQPNTGYLGAIEIMMAAARFLAEIYNKTALLPAGLSLDKLALVAGKSGIIRLIPPLDLIHTEDWQIITDQLYRSLNEQDPISKHDNQIEAFKSNFKEFLLNG